MNDRRTFFRKLAYGLIIVALVLVLAWLSPPATVESAGAAPSEGGLLARKRDQFGLSQANLGEIDPTSEAIKLATLGMRGVAVNLLWHKANEAQKTRDWTGLSATVTQIIKLEPHFLAVWRFQGWNLAYNVSADWDDFRDRYFWVIKGINFLKQGTTYNQHEPMLVWDVGWTTAQKIGRADERVQYRRLFRADDEFHGDRPVSQRDNWLVGKASFREAEQLVDGGSALRGLSPVLFRAEAPRCQINFATALEEDGTFGEVSRVAWERASADWNEFGNRDLPSFEGENYRLNDFERLTADHQQLVTEIETLAPDMRQTIQNEKIAAMSDEERALIDKPSDQRSREENVLVSSIATRLGVTWPEIVARIPDATQRARAEQLTRRLGELETLLDMIDTSRNQVMYPYWKTRCQLEHGEAALTARENVYRGDLALRETNIDLARTSYETAFAAWRKVLDEFPLLLNDGQTAEEMLDVVRRYQECLKQGDDPFPEPFILADLIQANQGYFDTPK